MKTKYCPHCKTVKPTEAFYRVKTRLSWICKPCKSAYARTYDKAKARIRSKRYTDKLRALYPEKYQTNSRKRFLKKKWNMSTDDYLAMVERQGGRCAICGISHKNLNFRLAIDHCHETNKIRGLLCRSCNSGIGLLGDSVKNLARAIKYLRRCRPV